MVKDYNLEIHYHPGKANVVADALSRKPHKQLRPKNAHLQEEMARLNVHIIPQGSHRKLSVQPTLEEEIRKAQDSDQNLMKIRKHTGENKAPYFRVDDKETLWYKNRICVPREGKIRDIIMDEAHNSAYSTHPGATNMYMYLRQKILVEWNEGGHCPVCRTL